VTNTVLPTLSKRAAKKFPNHYSRTNTMMDIGTSARKSHGNDIIALGVAAEIRKRRHALRNGKTAYLIHSLKHPDEVRRFREIYPRGFYLFAVNMPPEARKTHLCERYDLTLDQAEALMQRDKLEMCSYGQQVNQTFHLADFFVGWSDDIERVQKSVHRFVDIIFGDPHRTPTFGEYSMFMAFAASVRSADLSRQVGAVIAKDGEILSTGANDCPRAGGGLYWPTYNRNSKRFEDLTNGRDYVRGKDSNKIAQLAIIEEITNCCKKGRTPFSPPQIRRLKKILDDSPIGDLTEFGRVVHAEMEALLSCARKGISTRGATLYGTTFPGHNCAKHIIAAGIRRVVFVEPYLKSKATTHHDEIIKIEYPIPDDDKPDDGKSVRFEPFFGVGPRRFFDLFSMSIGVGTPLVRKNKTTGQAVTWVKAEAEPRVRMLSKSYLEAESAAADAFGELTRGGAATTA
jgi:deoxycytidylate deaminase